MSTDTTDIDEQIAAVAAGIIDHVNGEHDDAVLLLAQVLGGRPDATAASVTAIDSRRVRLEVHGDVLDLAFAEPATQVAEVSERLIALVAVARAAAPERPLTSIEEHRDELRGIRTFFTSVARVRALSPGVRRITFAGGDVHEISWLSPDQFVYLLLPPAGSTEMSIDRDFTWEGVREMPVDQQPRGAYYTVRHLRADEDELDIDVVLHGDDGPAGAWAARATVGDIAALWGPRTAWGPPAATSTYLLVADDTAFPALQAIVEHLSEIQPWATVHAIVELADRHECQPLAELPRRHVRWLFRDGAAPGTTTTLVDEVCRLTNDAEWPRSGVYAWGGGESRSMTAVRRHLRDEVGLSRSEVSMVGYWRRDEHADDD